MRGSRSFATAVSAAALVLFSLPAFAVYTEVKLPGKIPDQFESGSITLLQSGDTIPIVNRADCEQNKTADEKCGGKGMWFIHTKSDLADGTKVTVQTKDRDGTPHTFNGVVKDGDIQLDYDRTRPAPGTPAPQTTLRIGYGEYGGPSENGGLGVILIPNGERFIGTAPETLSGESAALTFPLGPSRRWFSRGHVSASNWDGSASALSPGGGSANGFVYHQPLGGDPGVSIGPNPAETKIDAEVDAWSIGADVYSEQIGGGHGYWVVGLELERFEQEIDGRWSSSAFTGDREISARSRQSILDQRYGVPLTLGANYPLSRSVSFTPFITATPAYQEQELETDFSSTCRLCGAAEQSVSQELEEEDDGFTWSAKAGIGLDFELSERFSMGIFGRYDFRADVPFANNRTSPNDVNTRMDDDKVDVWQAGLSFTYTPGGRQATQ